MPNSFMTQARKLTRDLRIVAFLFAGATFTAGSFAAPSVDPTFGDNGISRISATSGAEDKPSAAFRQADGKLLVAGVSSLRQSYPFVLRFNADGSLDGAFGQSGVALVDPGVLSGVGSILQVEARPDGTILLAGTRSSAVFVLRLRGNGAVDPTFAANGVYSQSTPSGWTVTRFVQQPDGGLLLVTGVSGISELRLTRIVANGVADPGFGPGGNRVLGGLPAGYTLQRDTVAADAQGGFVATLGGSAVNNGQVVGSQYLLVRVTPAGSLAAGFGAGGIVTGEDLGSPVGTGFAVSRTSDGKWLALTSSKPGAQSLEQVLLARLNDNGTIDSGFGVAGRAVLAGLRTFLTLRMAVLPDGGTVITESGTTFPESSGRGRAVKVGANGAADASYGQAGVAEVALSGYVELAFTAAFANDDGGLLLPGTAARAISCAGACLSRSGLDVAVARLSPAGQMQSGYGRGDGFTLWNRLELSADDINDLYVMPSGKTVFVGFTVPDGSYKLLASRLQRDGHVDAAFGNQGRTVVDPTIKCYGPVQAAAQPDGGAVVVAGAAAGSFCTVGSTQAFRLDRTGTPTPNFGPRLAVPESSNATVAIAARPDGRIVYGVFAWDFDSAADAFTRTASLNQIHADGTADASFGAGGRVRLSVPTGEYSRESSVAILPDGSVLLAVLTNHALRVFKVDAKGVPATGFGTGGAFAYSGEFTQAGGFGRKVRLVALADNNVLVLFDASTVQGASEIKVLRLSADGRLNSAVALPAGTAPGLAAGLPDGSVIVAGVEGSGTEARAVLRRLLPSDALDTGFGAQGVYAVPNLQRVDALGLTPDLQLVVAGQDAISTLLTRLSLAGVIEVAPVVEFHNSSLDHYFVTANAAEATAIDQGAAGPGWSRTGNTFKSGGASMVCRFYGNATINPATGTFYGPNSHFYTADPAECAGLIGAFNPSEKSWKFESYDFATTTPLFAANNGTTCPEGTVPVYRAYNNGFARGIDSNHRLTANFGAYQDTVAAGWVGEGIAMCAPQ